MTENMSRDERQAAWAALRMIRDAVGELFGPRASIESEEAVLLRGPEYHHEAEAIIAAIARIDAERGEPVALADIAAERRRQIEVEGWTPEHDDQHNNGEMAAAAACYAVSRRIREGSTRSSERFLTRSLWPWEPDWWKPKDRRRDLIRAAALIVAEIERRDRKG